ncbi:hypothetical protein STCU_10915 [Strigomonas culicis]|uniref:Uncharacterized protein n=1 Tax=Strigomonas culicis TaxID=28005 RepID=S9UQI2_9TRYP|nr:hypothetical protein STCU_10915 [Strigomonas culicis]|eukprot:EPY16911.1 hypothetical protein STCU_10915 [Strigomonas culicis]
MFKTCYLRLAPAALGKDAKAMGQRLATATGPSPPAAVGPTLAMPTFRPQPFEVDKFLSLQKCDMGHYMQMRQAILERMAELTEEVDRLQQQATKEPHRPPPHGQLRGSIEAGV